MMENKPSDSRSGRISYDCVSAPAPEDLKLICSVCEAVLLSAGFSVTYPEPKKFQMGKCAVCLRRSPVYPAICRMEKN